MKKLLEEYIEGRKSAFEQVADQIWGFAETDYEEVQSAQLLEDFLEAEGFQVETGIGGIPTAFRATAGSGAPVIAFLGEYDALPGLSQEADQTVERPCMVQGSGHGCGHNMLATGALEAACALKNYLKAAELPGTVVYMGCPAEEGGAGKAFLIRSGCFEDVDIALTWHPTPDNGIWNQALANVKITYSFSGRSAHAAACPQEGRSALDACELMNVGVNYLREHVSPAARMHYAYLNAGGTAANVVPSYAKLLYILRSDRIEELEEMVRRVSDIARGAALMTGTTVEEQILYAYRELLDVPEMDDLLADCMKECLPISYTEAELEYARKFQAIELGKGREDKGKAGEENVLNGMETGIKERVQMSSASTDVGDVSWVVPTGNICIASVAAGTVMHKWTATAQGKSAVAYKGMHTAARILAEAGRRLMEEAELREQIVAGFIRERAGRTYYSLIPEDRKPDLS